MGAGGMPAPTGFVDRHSTMRVTMPASTVRLP